MARNNRVFISFAVEDQNFRSLLVGQARNDNSPFEFVDMSVKQPWDSAWKTNCRTKIRGCDGMIALISRHSERATGQLWEVACAKEEDIPVCGMYVNIVSRPSVLPPEFYGVRIMEWGWNNIARFVNSL